MHQKRLMESAKVRSNDEYDTGIKAFIKEAKHGGEKNGR